MVEQVLFVMDYFEGYVLLRKAFAQELDSWLTIKVDLHCGLIGFVTYRQRF